MSACKSSVSPPIQNHSEKVMTVGCNVDERVLSRGRGCEGHLSIGREVMPVDEGIEGQQEQGEMFAEVEQEVARAAKLPTYAPTRSEYLEHCVTHNPFRPWCKHCVEGRGQEYGHYRRRDVDPTRVPLVAFDYASMSDIGDLFGSDVEVEDDTRVRLLIVAMRTPDDLQTCVFGHVIPAKGVDIDKFSVDCLVEDILWSEYTSVMLKSDNEPAILQLLIAALRELRINGLKQVLSENSPEYDPQSNGLAESVVKRWKGMFRTQKSSLEDHLGMKNPVKHPLIAWLVKWAGEVLIWEVKGLDGLTAYQRIRGKPFRTRLAAFGEVVRYKLRPREPLSNSPDDQRSHEGIFLGVDRRTGQYIIFGNDRIEFARTMWRVSDSEKWNAQPLQRVDKSPKALHEPRGEEVVFRERTDPAAEPPAPKLLVSRDIYLKRSDFDQWGLTVGCPRCDHERAYGPNRTKQGHSQACRRRIIAKLAETPAGQARIASANQRMDKQVYDMSRAGAQGEDVGIAPDENVVPNTADFSTNPRDAAASSSSSSGTRAPNPYPEQQLGAPVLPRVAYGHSRQRGRASLGNYAEGTWSGSNHNL